MKKIAAILGFLSVLWAALSIFPTVAQNPQFPQTLPANTVVGRTGIGSGPAQAIPFSLLSTLGVGTTAAGNSCPGTLNIYQPFANTTSAPTGTILNVWDGAQCVPWATLNQTAHTISFLTGSQPWATGTSLINVPTYDGVTNSGKTGWQITNTDSSALTGLEHYGVWIGSNTNGTGDGSPAATTYALGLSAIKNNWTTTTTAGEYVGLNIAARGGDNNVLQSGDVSGININTGASFSNNLAQQFEGVSGYFPGGSTTGSLFLNTQIGSIRASGLDTGANTGIGFFTQAQNGLLGYAFQASNLCASPKFGTCSKWLGAFNYVYDDGTHTAYNAFNVNQAGQLTLAGFGAAGTNQKTLRVGTSVPNSLEIVNAGNTAVIANLTDAGVLSSAAGMVSGANAGTAGSLQLNGSISGALALQVSATGGHIFWSSSSTPTANTCAGFSLASGSDDITGTVSYTSATTCSITWGTAYAAAPFCTITPIGSTPTTVAANPSTSGLAVTFGTAQTSFTYLCWNS